MPTERTKPTAPQDVLVSNGSLVPVVLFSGASMPALQFLTDSIRTTVNHTLNPFSCPCLLCAKLRCFMPLGWLQGSHVLLVLSSTQSIAILQRVHHAAKFSTCSTCQWDERHHMDRMLRHPCVQLLPYGPQWIRFTSISLPRGHCAPLESETSPFPSALWSVSNPLSKEL